MPDTERRDHVIRARLPWRTDDLTECGRPVEDVGSTITREQLRWRLKQYGQQRTAFTVCMTCWGVARSEDVWETNPTGMISRDMRRGRGAIVYYDYQRPVDGVPQQPTGPHVDRLSVELHAIAEMIAAHRDEFDQRVQAATQAALFADRRRRAEKAKRHG